MPAIPATVSTAAECPEGARAKPQNAAWSWARPLTFAATLLLLWARRMKASESKVRLRVKSWITHPTIGGWSKWLQSGKAA